MEECKASLQDWQSMGQQAVDGVWAGFAWSLLTVAGRLAAPKHGTTAAGCATQRAGADGRSGGLSGVDNDFGGGVPWCGGVDTRSSS